MLFRALIVFGAMTAAAVWAPTGARAENAGVSPANIPAEIDRQEARWVRRRYCRVIRRCFTRVRVRRICRPYRRCYTRWVSYRRPYRRRICRRYYRGGRWHRRCWTRVYYRVVRRPRRICRVYRRCHVVRRPYRVCRPYRRCTWRRVWVN